MIRPELVFLLQTQRWVTLQQRLDLCVILIRMNGAGGVYQRSFGSQQRQKSIQKGLLLGQKATDGLRRHPPTGIGVTGEGSKPRTRGIYQNPLKGFTPLGVLLQKIGGIRSYGIDGRQAQPGRIGRNALEPSG